MGKKVCNVDDGVVSPQTKWEKVSPEVLALIFVRLAAEERVRTVAMVCRAWLEAVAGPYCWADIDIERWCRRRDRSSDLVDSTVRKLVRRSKCTFRRLSACKIGDPGFSYTANCGRCLKVLQIPMSIITDHMVERHAESLVNLTILDISYCSNISSKGIRAFGTQCKYLVHFNRSMPPTNLQPAPVDNSEALAIAETMLGIRRLELCFGRFGNGGVSAILAQCKELAHLDIHGCWNVELEGGPLDKCQKLAMFVSPWFESEFDSDDLPDESDGVDEDSSSSKPD